MKLTIKKMVIDSSFTLAGCTNGDYWFNAFEYMTEYRNFENLVGITSLVQAFVSCCEPRSVFCDSSYDATGVSGSMMLSGCNQLVGSTSFAPVQTTAATVLKFSDNGVLVDPDDDSRIWFWGTVYADGGLTISASAETDTSREVVAHGDACYEAVYKLANWLP